LRLAVRREFATLICHFQSRVLPFGLGAFC
jgi:hypothetical protein